MVNKDRDKICSGFGVDRSNSGYNNSGDFCNFTRNKSKKYLAVGNKAVGNKNAKVLRGIVFSYVLILCYLFAIFPANYYFFGDNFLVRTSVLGGENAVVVNHNVCGLYSYKSTADKCAYIGGFPIAIALSTDGVIIDDTATVETAFGKTNPSAQLMKGDFLVELNNQKISCVADIDKTLNGLDFESDIGWKKQDTKPKKSTKIFQNSSSKPQKSTKSNRYDNVQNSKNPSKSSTPNNVKNSEKPSKDYASNNTTKDSTNNKTNNKTDDKTGDKTDTSKSKANKSSESSKTDENSTINSTKKSAKKSAIRRFLRNGKNKYLAKTAFFNINDAEICKDYQPKDCQKDCQSDDANSYQSSQIYGNLCKLFDYNYQLVDESDIENSNTNSEILGEITSENSEKISEIEAVVLRNNERKRIKLRPSLEEFSNKYRLGLIVRDYILGVGTVSFIKEDGSFGALGHPISDSVAGRVPIRGGVVFSCRESGVVKGERGTPGELKVKIGSMKSPIGTVSRNTDCGIFGKFNSLSDILNAKKYAQNGVINPDDGCKLHAVSARRQVNVGNAYICSGVDGSVEYYKVEIIRAISQNSFDDKGIVVRVVDKRLIEKTGGIVQGMSGSPIIQNGMIVGAITHVFVNEPTKGFGIYCDFMFDY